MPAGADVVEKGRTLGEPVPSWKAAYGASPWLRKPPTNASAAMVPTTMRRRRTLAGRRASVGASWRDLPLTTTSGRGRRPNSGSRRIITAITSVKRTRPITAW